MRESSIIPHTADVRLAVEADSLPELFIAALEGMNAILASDSVRRTLGDIISIEVHVDSPDRTSLLIDFLSEVLTQSYLHKAILHKADFLKLDNEHMRARLTGRYIAEFSEDIKAVTYHEAEIKQNDRGHFVTNIIFDI